MRGWPPTLIDVFGRSSGRPPVSDATSLLFDLPGFRVVSVEGTPLGVRRVVVMQVAAEHACPRCGVLAGGKPYDVREMRVKDLPVGHRPLLVIWRKRRYRCRETSCMQRVFTERSEQLPPRHRLTRRLRERLEHAASRSARALSDVAAEYGVSWWSVHRALLVTALDHTGEVPAVRMLGLDETRARSLRWSWEGQRWQLSNPWMTSFVDLDTGRQDAEYSARLLGTVDPLSVKHTVADEAAVERTHPTFFPLLEQWEQHTQAIQALRVGQAFIRMRDDTVRRGRTPSPPNVSVPPERLQAVQQHYLHAHFRPVPHPVTRAAVVTAATSTPVPASVPPPRPIRRHHTDE